jgi:hypothetical protein
MSSTPLISCSIGAATVSETVCRLLRRLVAAAGQGDCEQNDQGAENVK